MKLKNTLRTIACATALTLGVTGCASVEEAPITDADVLKADDEKTFLATGFDMLGRVNGVLALAGQFGFSLSSLWGGTDYAKLSPETIQEIADKVGEVVDDLLFENDFDRDVARINALLTDEKDYERPTCLETYAVCLDDSSLAGCGECRDSITTMREDADNLRRAANGLFHMMTRSGLEPTQRLVFTQHVQRIGSTLIMAHHEQELAELALGTYAVNPEDVERAAADVRDAVDELEALFEEHPKTRYELKRVFADGGYTLPIRGVALYRDNWEDTDLNIEVTRCGYGSSYEEAYADCEAAAERAFDEVFDDWVAEWNSDRDDVFGADSDKLRERIEDFAGGDFELALPAVEQPEEEEPEDDAEADSESDAESDSEMDSEADGELTLVAEAEDLRSNRGRPFQGDYFRLVANGSISASWSAPQSGRYVIVVPAFAQQAGDEAAKMALEVDGERIATFEVTNEDRPVDYAAEVDLERGGHTISVAFINDYYNPGHSDPAERDRNLVIDSISVGLVSAN